MEMMSLLEKLTFTKTDGLYLEVNTFCILVLLKLIQKSIMNFNRQYEIKLLLNVLFISILLFISNAGWILAAKENGVFICRFGDDEFILICERETDTEVETICAKINENIAEECKKENTKYLFTVSCGFATFSEKTNTIPSLISAADKKLYQAKANRS